MQDTTTAPLYKLWERTIKMKGNAPAASPEEWREQVYELSRRGIGTEEALQYLYTRQPSYEGFAGWLRDYAGEVAATMQHAPVLTREDYAFWDKNGYIVINDAVPAEQCVAAQDAIWQYLDAQSAVPHSWYAGHPGKSGMMLSFFRHRALVANRNSAKIRKVYEELYGNTDIYLLVDKVSFNPPETGKHKFTGSALHWDVSLQQPIPFILQGLLYLNEVSAEDGAFHCVPGFHNEVGAWLAALPEGTDARAAALAALRPVAVPGNAGDLVIWHQALPHCATPNKGTTPRMVQYLAYKPIQVADSGVWI